VQKLLSASARLKELREKTDGVIVAYSGGKDSKVVLELCHRAGFKISSFFMEFVPGISFLEKDMAETEKKYGITIKRYPHWLLPRVLKGGIYCDPSMEWDFLPEYTVSDIYAAARDFFNCQYVLTGAKRSDSLWRRRNIKATEDEFLIHPIQDFLKLDVLAALQIFKIPLPPTDNCNASGIDLSRQNILWLYDSYPEDFKKISTYFPYIGAIVKRRELYACQ
jgi:3'-phosphoadenosine 5'-phosphosulfate sulfotransferase (PAPS reductase)/FAD synthetase